MAVFTGKDLQEMRITSTCETNEDEDEFDAFDETAADRREICATEAHCSRRTANARSEVCKEVSPSRDETTSSSQQAIVISDVPILSRARASLPASYLVINEIPNVGHSNDGDSLIFGVFARKSVPQKTQFGPVEGVIMEYNANRPRQQPNLIVYINDTMILDQSDENTSNWMRFVRTARNNDEQNLALVAKDQTQPNPENANELITITKFFFMTTRAINACEELKVWYSNEYLERFKVNIVSDQQMHSPSFSVHSEDDISRPLGFLQNDISALPGGHKLRNKIAKTQQLQQQQVNSLKSSNDCDADNRPEEQHDTGQRTTPEQPQYKCDICQKVFPRPYSLRRHKIMHSGEKKFKCAQCGMCFSDVYNRNRHAKRHAKASNRKPLSRQLSKDLNKGKNGTVECIENASEELISLTSPTSHADDLPVAKKSNPINGAKTSNLRPKPFRCLQCYKSFTTDDRLLRHAIVHSSDEQVKPLACELCDKRFLNNSALSCHLKVHSTPKDQPRRYDCVICKEWFDCTQARKDHCQTHADLITGHFTCPTCSKKFDEFTGIRKHIRAFHSDKQYPCTQCEKVFPRPDKLKLHMLRHSDHREFLCQNCGKQFKRKDKLKEHMQRMHAPDREAKLAAKQAAKHAQQVNNNHKKFIPKVSPTDYHRFIYKCHTCLLGFKRRGMLVNHLAKRHPDIPPETVPELNLPILKTTRDYYCQYCDKIYKSSSKRKAHILKNHPGKPLPLSNRHKGGLPAIPGVPNPTYSATVGSITTHPHYCDWCHKQYASKAKLLQHQRKKHPEKIAIINANVRARNRVLDASPVDNSSVTTMSNLTTDTSVTQPSLVATALSSPILETSSNPGVQPSLGSTNLITILGNIGNLNSIIATVSSTDSDLHDLLQANPSAANDLLTQAMSELTQTRDNGSGEPNAATLIVPVTDNDVVGWT